MTKEQAIKRIKNGDFGGRNGVIIEVRKEILERQGLLEAYKTVYPNSFQEFYSNDYLTLQEAKLIGII